MELRVRQQRLLPSPEQPRLAAKCVPRAQSLRPSGAPHTRELPEVPSEHAASSDGWQLDPVGQLGGAGVEQLATHCSCTLLGAC